MSLADEIRKIAGCEFLPQHDLTTLTTMRLSSNGDLVIIKSVSALQELLPLLQKHQRSYLVVGWGANQILPAHCEHLIIHLELPLGEELLQSAREHYDLPASVGLNQLTGHAVKHGIMGWEVFTGIPASLGGAIYMNAGTNLGEIGTLITKVHMVTPMGALRTEEIGAGSFSYRKNHFVGAGEVIVGAEIKNPGLDSSIPEKIREYLEYRKKTQPLATRNCGCVFKNPTREMPAGKLIDLLGLKGLSLRGLRISTKHANFIENAGASTWEELQTLIKLIQFQMDHFYGIEFELEVKIPYD